MRVLALAGNLRIAALLATLLTAPFCKAAGAPTGQPVVYALTPNNTITVIDTGDQQILNTLTLSGPAGYIVGTPDGKQLYVTGTDPTSQNPDGDAVVRVFNTQTGTVTATLPLNLFPVGMVISADGTRVYVATTFLSQSAGEVAVIDTATNTVIARIADTAPNSVGIALAPNGQRVYVPMTGGNAGQGALDVINTVSDTIVGAPDIVAGFNQYLWAATSPDSTQVYTYDHYSNGSDDASQIFVLDAVTNQPLGTVPAVPSGTVLSTPLPSTSILYGTAGGSVLAYNTQSNSVAAAIPVAASIFGLALTPNGQQLYVADSNTQSIAIINTATNTLIGSVAVAGATAMAIVAAPPTPILTPPELSLQVNPASVPPGASASVGWNSSAATTCTATGAWSGSEALQGASTVSFTVPGSYRFTLSCVGPGGTTVTSAKLTVVPGSTLTANATDIPANGTAVLSWTAFAGATSCYAAGTWGGDVPLSGSKTVGPLPAGSYAYQLYCTGPSGGQNVTTTITAFTAGALQYTSLEPANDNIYALGVPGTAVAGTGLDGHGYAFDSQALPNPLTALGQTFAIGAVSKPTGASYERIALTPAPLANLTILETAVNGNQLDQPFVVTYSDGTVTTYLQSLSDWGSYGPLAGETVVVAMNHRLTATGAQQGGTFTLHAFRIVLDSSRVATSLQLPKNRNVIVLAVNETRAPQASPESISAAFNVDALATVGHASPNGRLDGHGYAYDAALLPSGFTGAGQQFMTGPADQLDAVSSATLALAAKNRYGITLLATAVNGSQPAQAFVVTYQDGSSGLFTQSLSDWNQPQNYPGESIVRNAAFRITPTGVRQGGNWNVYAYSFQTDPNKQIVSVTLPKNRNVVVLAINTLTP